LDDGATGTSCGSSFLPNRFSSPDPFAAAPLAAAPFAFAAGAFAAVVPDVLVLPDLLGVPDVLDVPLLVAGLAAVPGLAAPALAAPALAAPVALAEADPVLAAAPEAFRAAPDPDAACVADAPTVALPTTGRLRNRKCCCPSVQMFVVTQ
jgi:hypothetical protein